MGKKPKPEELRGIDALGRPLQEPDNTADRGDANDPKAFDQAKNEESARKRNDDLVVQSIMATRQGRDWFYRRLEICHIYGSTADLGVLTRGADPYVTYFHCGEENIGKQLLAEVQRAAPELYLTMISEQNEVKAQRNG